MVDLSPAVGPLPAVDFLAPLLDVRVGVWEQVGKCEVPHSGKRIPNQVLAAWLYSVPLAAHHPGHVG